jgi:hypothetical protein
MFANPLFSYNYATAKSVIKAIKDIENDYREDDNFWADNIDTKNIRTEISNFCPPEKLISIEDNSSPFIDYRDSESIFRKVLRIISMNGHMLPEFLLKNKTVRQTKSYRGVFRNIFRYKKVLYYYEQEKIGYIATHNKGEFFKCLMSFIFVSAIFLIRFKKIKKKQQQNISFYTSFEFWKKLYDESYRSPSTFE